MNSVHIELQKLLKKADYPSLVRAYTPQNEEERKMVVGLLTDLQNIQKKNLKSFKFRHAEDLIKIIKLAIQYKMIASTDYLNKVILNLTYLFKGYITLDDTKGMQGESGIRLIKYQVPQYKIEVYEDDNGATIYNSLFDDKRIGEYEVKGVYTIMKSYGMIDVDEEDEGTVGQISIEEIDQPYEFFFFRDIDRVGTTRLIRYNLTFEMKFYRYLRDVINEILLHMFIPVNREYEKEKKIFLTRLSPYVFMLLSGRISEVVTQVISIITIDIGKGNEIMKIIKKYAKPSNNLTILKELFEKSYKEVNYSTSKYLYERRLKKYQTYSNIEKKLKDLPDNEMAKVALKAAQKELEEETKTPIYTLFDEIFK